MQNSSIHHWQIWTEIFQSPFRLLLLVMVKHKRLLLLGTG